MMPDIGTGGGMKLSVGIGLNLTGFEALSQITKEIEVIGQMALKAEAAVASLGSSIRNLSNIGNLSRVASGIENSAERITRSVNRAKQSTDIGAGLTSSETPATIKRFARDAIGVVQSQIDLRAKTDIGAGLMSSETPAEIRRLTREAKAIVQSQINMRTAGTEAESKRTDIGAGLTSSFTPAEIRRFTREATGAVQSQIDMRNTAEAESKRTNIGAGLTSSFTPAEINRFTREARGIVQSQIDTRTDAEKKAISGPEVKRQAAIERRESVTIPLMPGQNAEIPGFLSQQKNVSEAEITARNRSTKAIGEETAARGKMSGIFGSSGGLLAAGFNFYAAAKVAETVFHAAAKVPTEESNLRRQGYSEADIRRQHDVALQVATSMMGASTADVMTMQRKAGAVIGQENVTPGLLKSLMVDAIAIGRTTGEDTQTVAQGLLRGMEARQHLTEGGKFNEASAKRESDLITRATLAAGGDAKVMQLMHTLLFSSTMSQFDSKENADKTMGLVLAATMSMGKTAGIDLNRTFSEIAGGKLPTRPGAFSILANTGLLEGGPIFRPNIKGAMTGGGKSPFADTSNMLNLDATKGLQENVDRVVGGLRRGLTSELHREPNQQEMFTRINEVFPQTVARLINWMESEQGRAQIARETANVERVPVGEALQRAQELADPELALQDFTKSIETLAGEAINLTGVMHGLTIASDFMKNAALEFGKFSRDHPVLASILPSTETATNMGLSALGGVALRAAFAGIGVTGLLEAMGLTAVGPAFALLVPAVYGVTEAFKSLDSWLKTILPSFFNNKGLDDIKKNGVLQPKFEPEKSKGLLDQIFHALSPESKWMEQVAGLTGTQLPQMSPTDQKEEDERESNRFKFMNAIATPTTSTPEQQTTRRGNAMSWAHPVTMGHTNIPIPLPNGATPNPGMTATQVHDLQHPPGGGTGPQPATMGGATPIPSVGQQPTTTSQAPNMKVNTMEVSMLIIKDSGRMGGSAASSGRTGAAGESVGSGKGVGAGDLSVPNGIGSGKSALASELTAPNGISPEKNAALASVPGGAGNFLASRFGTATAGIGGGKGAFKGPTGSTLDMIEKFESGGKNIPNYRYDPTHTAQGYFQITNSTWRDAASHVPGASQYPNAMAAPKEMQRQVAEYLLKTRGLDPWKTNAPLMAEVAKQNAIGGATHALPQQMDALPQSLSPAAMGSMIGHHQNEIMPPNIQGPQVNPDQTDVPANNMHVTVHGHHYLDGDEMAATVAQHFIGGGSTASPLSTAFDSKAMPLVPGASVPRW